MPIRAYFYIPSIVLFIPILSYWLINFYDNKRYIFVYLLSISILFSVFISARFIRNQFVYAYNAGRTNIYNILKIDILSKYEHDLIILPQYSNITDKRITKQLLEYANSRFFEIKLLNLTNKNNLEIIIPTTNINVNQTSIYFANISGLQNTAVEFKDFILVAIWELPRVFKSYSSVYVYIHKNRL
jgi:hypothetical protein